MRAKYYYIVKNTTLAVQANNKKDAKRILNEWHNLSLHECDIVRISRKDLIDKMLAQF